MKATELLHNFINVGSGIAYISGLAVASSVSFIEMIFVAQAGGGLTINQVGWATVALAAIGLVSRNLESRSKEKQAELERQERAEDRRERQLNLQGQIEQIRLTDKKTIDDLQAEKNEAKRLADEKIATQNIEIENLKRGLADAVTKADEANAKAETSAADRMALRQKTEALERQIEKMATIGDINADQTATIARNTNTKIADIPRLNGGPGGEINKIREEAKKNQPS